MSDAAVPRVERVEGPEGLAALGGAWNALLARCPQGSVFLRHEWALTWWEVFGAGRRLCTLVARDPDGQVCAIAPMVLGRGPGRLVGRLPHLLLLGQGGETLAEHLDWIVPPHARGASAFAALAAAAFGPGAGFDALCFQRVREDSPSLAGWERALAERGMAVERRPAGESPFAALPASFDELLASRSRNFRRQWRNSLGRLAREGPLALRIAGRDLGWETAFEHLVRLHRARWGPGEGRFRSPGYLTFHRRLVERLHPEGAVLLALLEVGGRTLAARYDFLHAGKVWCFQGGWEPGHERARPGTVITGLVLEWAIGEGYREYDFLSGDDPYKDRWATGSRRLVDLAAFAPRLGVRCVRALAAAKDALRRLVARRGPRRAPPPDAQGVA